MLIDAIKAEGIEGLTLLDIGGGVGVVQHALLKAGAAGVVSVDASTAYIRAAEEGRSRIEVESGISVPIVSHRIAPLLCFL